MSHYCSAIISQDPYKFDELLEPFCESDERYFQREPVTRDHVRRRFLKFMEENPGWDLQDDFEHMHHWATEEPGWYKYEEGYGYYIWANPNSIYDWYSIDGKDDMFESTGDYIAKSDAYSVLYDFDQYDKDHDRYWNFRKVSDIDWDASNEHDDTFDRKYWRAVVRGVPTDHQYFTIEHPAYLAERFKTEDNYVYECCMTKPYNFITPDGVLHAPGNVGWFAVSDDTYESMHAYIEDWEKAKEQYKDCYITFADLHI